MSGRSVGDLVRSAVKDANASLVGDRPAEAVGWRDV
jgi:hypothetical protein